MPGVAARLEKALAVGMQNGLAKLQRRPAKAGASVHVLQHLVHHMTLLMCCCFQAIHRPCAALQLRALLTHEVGVYVLKWDETAQQVTTALPVDPIASQAPVPCQSCAGKHAALRHAQVAQSVSHK